MKYDRHTDYIDDSVKDYFEEQCLSHDIQMVPGYWPSMRTKEDVDKRIQSLKLMTSLFDSRKVKL